MARLPQVFLAQIKAIPLPQVLEAGGHHLRPAGQGRLSCSCPIPGHDDKTPSFFVDEAKNLWKCFGACDAGGDVIALVQRLESLGFVDAVAWLARFAGLEFQATKYKGASRIEPGRVPEACPLEPGLPAAEIGRRVVAFYHAQLLNRQSRGWQYLESRGLADDRLIDRFRLGFAPAGKDGLLRSVPDCQRKAGKEIREQLLAAGWSREIQTKRGGQEFSSARELLGNCITVPVIGPDGAIAECYGRKTTDRKDSGPVHFYLPGKHAGVWNADDCIGADGSVILCEAAFDAMTLWVHGFENVTWAYGSGGFAADHLELFKSRAKTVHIAYDNDDAGNKAADKLAHELIAAGLSVHRMLPPLGVDVNALALDGGADAVAEFVRSSQWWGGSSTADETPAEPEKTPAIDRPLAPPCPDYRRENDDVLIDLGTRLFRLRGLFANKTDMALKSNVRAQHNGEMYADSFDLYQAKARAHFIRCAADELGLHEDVMRSDVANVLRVAETALDAHRSDIAAKRDAAAAASIPTMTDDERDEALGLLRDPDLLQRISDDLSACGLVGEPINKLTCYLAATSRLMDDPMGVIIQSSSAAGKSSLMDAVLRLMPEESLTQYSSMTEQSLFYQGENALKNKILAIAEEAGAGKIAYSLKILISDHFLTIAAPRQNPETGCFETINYRVDGPTAVLMTTTADDDDLDPELLNRCLVMSVDETADQTAAILGRQRARFSLDGLVSADAVDDIRRRHHNAQRLLRPLRVVIPQAHQLTFATHLPRLRRDHMKYLNMICCIALLHQQQRTVKRHASGFDYIEATTADIVAANEIIAVVLGRSIAGMLPHTRELLELADRFVSELADAQEIERDAVRFTRRQFREWCGWGDTRLRKHITRLVEWELMEMHRHGAGVFAYSLHYTQADRERSRVRLHLIDPAKLAKTCNGSGASAPLESRSAPQKHPIRTPKTPRSHPGKTNGKAVKNGALDNSGALDVQNRPCGGAKKSGKSTGPSYRDGAA